MTTLYDFEADTLSGESTTLDDLCGKWRAGVPM